jgi:hypothetical protein
VGKVRGLAAGGSRREVRFKPPQHARIGRSAGATGHPSVGLRAIDSITFVRSADYRVWCRSAAAELAAREAAVGKAVQAACNGSFGRPRWRDIG